MKCPSCSKKARKAPIQIGNGTRYICENCGQIFVDRGKATKKEINDLQNSQFQQVMKHGMYKPLRLRIRALESYSPAGNIRLHDPRQRTCVGKCRVRR